MGQTSLKRIVYCLDAHPLVWYMTGDRLLSSKAKEIIKAIFHEPYPCFIPSIVLLEIFHLSLKKKTYLFPEFIQAIRRSNISIVPLDKDILSACYKLPDSFEIHDRIIVATALVYNAVLITKDTIIRKSKEVETVW